MKKMLKKTASFIAAAALALSSFSMLTVNAEEETPPSPVMHSASVAAQLRAKDETWTAINTNSSKFMTEGDIENTATAYFGSFYHFDRIALPENAVVTKVTITVRQGSQTFSGKPFAVLYTDNPTDTTNINDVFNAAAAAKRKSMDEATAAEVMAGETKTTVLDNGRTESIELTGENADKYFNAQTSNSYFMYNKDMTDTGKRPLLPNAQLEVEYAVFDPSAPAVKTASVAAQLRGSDADWTSKNSNSTKFVTSGDMENTATAYFGSFYHFDRIILPSDAIVTKVTITVNQGSLTFSGKPFVVVHTENPADLANIDNVFNTVKTARATALNAETAAEVVAGETKTTVLDNGRTESIELTGENIEKYFNSKAANSYFMYNKDTADTNKRPLKPDARIEIEYRLPIYMCSVTSKGETVPYAKYESLGEAVTAAKAEDTITLLDNVSLENALDIDKKLTIDGGNHTITTANRVEYKGGGTFTLKNLTITGGGNLNIPQQHKIDGDNLVIDKIESIGGAGETSKGTIKNSVITYMTLYGNISLVNTQVGEVVVKAIKTSNDIPKINADNASVISKLSVAADSIKDGVVFPYAFMTGELKAIGTAELPEGYEYNSSTGEIKVREAEPDKETTPNIVIDYVNEKLTGFTVNEKYIISGTEITPTDSEVMIDNSYFGTDLSIVKSGNGTTTIDSDAQSLAIPARPSVPVASDFTVTQPDTIGGTGSIGGITAAMEYKLSTANTWTAGTGETITGIAGGATYVVRKKAIDGTSFKSGECSISIEAFNAQKEETPSIAIDYVNEKLTGFEEGNYTLNNNVVTPDRGELAIDNSYFGTDLSIVKSGNGTTTIDSDAQSLTIPGRPSVPVASDFTVTQPDTIGGTGSIGGITAAMEYKLSTANTWTAGTGETITGIAGGATYVVRKKAIDGTSFKSGEYSISIETFGAQKEETPNITIDYENEKLTGFTANEKYMIGGTEVTPADSELAIDKAWFGTDLSILKSGNGTTTNNSDAQNLSVPDRPAAPVIDTTDETADGANDGKIIGTDSTMEYKRSTAKAWMPIEGAEVTNLEPGVYMVRVKATENGFAGISSTVVISKCAASEPDDPELAIGNIDQTLEDKTVVDITVKNPTEETNGGVLIAVLYDTDRKCVQVSLVTADTVEFKKVTDGYIKAFLWNSLSGNNAMTPILDSKEKSI